MMTTCYPEEHLLNLTINGKAASPLPTSATMVTLVCTNEALRELIVGYLFNEGVIASIEDITQLHISHDGSEASALIASDWNPEGTIRASGLGGPELIGDKIVRRISPGRVYPMDEIVRCAQDMRETAVKYKLTGGVHCSALFRAGRVLARFEDIGRHNTLDKLCGDLLLRGVSANDALLVTTGRMSSDMVRKAAMMGVSVIASYTTPTQLAFEDATKSGMTLVSYVLSRDKTRICCNPQRICGAQSCEKPFVTHALPAYIGVAGA